MSQEKIKTLIDLYRVGRYIKLIEKEHNNDFMLRAMILIALHEEPLTIQELVDYLGVGYPTVSEKIADLVTQQLVNKEYGNDSRFRTVYLTQRGRVHVKLVHKSLKPYCSTIFHNFNTGE